MHGDVPPLADRDPASAALELTFFVEGEPVAKARPRLGIVKASGKTFAYTPKRTQQWETTVRWLARAAASARGWKPLTENVEVCIIVHRLHRRGDADNYAKAILDGMNGIAFTDDSTVRSLMVRVKDVPQDPGAWVAVRTYVPAVG